MPYSESMRRLATALIVSLTLGVGVGLAVQSEQRPAAAEFAVKMGATVRVARTDLLIGLERVTDDSRCPVEAKCISAGDAAVVLSVRQGRAAAAHVTLHTMAAPREVTHGAWRIQLVDLVPQPSLRQPPAQKDYVATVRVDPVK